MPLNPLATQPPDDTGTDTFKRYVYQAHIAFRYCLSCVTEKSINSVILEHFEDLLVEYEDKWHFIQIKTRNPNQGAWRISSAIDGLSSLFRTYKEVKELSVRFSLFLEGAVARGDLLNHLVTGFSLIQDSKLQEEIVTKVANGIQEKKEDVHLFLNLVSVQPNQPSRDDIAAVNLAIIGKSSPHLSTYELRTIYSKTLKAIEGLMLEERLCEILPNYIKDPDSTSITVQAKVSAKRLTYDQLSPLLSSINDGPYFLLKRITNPGIPLPSNLETKLTLGGAEEFVIQNAKELRANASIREAELLSSDLFGDADSKLDDVRQRLLVLANSAIQKCVSDEKPAIKAWHDVLEKLMDRKEVCDPNKTFRQDPFLLLGEVCVLSDECKIHWGIPLS